MAKRGPYGPGTTRRAEIIDAALALFGEVGYHAASLRDIAARAGMSHTGLLRHFPKKELLLEAVLTERELRVREDFDLETSEPLAMLRNHVRLMHSNARTPGIVELYTVLSAEASSPAHPAHAYFVKRYRKVRHRFEAVFVALRDSGQLKNAVDPAGAAMDVIAHSDGMQVQWLMEPGSIDLGRETRRFVQGYLTVDLDESDAVVPRVPASVSDAL
jgi:AcrR family transcriptional regulator